jgi:hypothetical protein
MCGISSRMSTHRCTMVLVRLIPRCGGEDCLKEDREANLRMQSTVKLQLPQLLHQKYDRYEFHEYNFALVGVLVDVRLAHGEDFLAMAAERPVRTGSEYFSDTTFTSNIIYVPRPISIFPESSPSSSLSSI